MLKNLFIDYNIIKQVNSNKRNLSFYSKMKMKLFNKELNKKNNGFKKELKALALI